MSEYQSFIDAKSTRSQYDDFLASKAASASLRGLRDVPALSSHLFPFQRSAVEFNLRAGGTGLFLDTGLGKTVCQLEYCEHARAATNGMALIEAFREHQFKLSASATPAPNDHMELGQHSDFCGIMASNEMLSRFFINDTSTASQEWRLKRHAVQPFWDWMASWSRMAQMPSDMGYSDDGFELPPMTVTRHRTHNAPIVSGGLFGDEIFGHIYA